MKVIINVFALIGLLAVAMVGVVGVKMQPFLAKLDVAPMEAYNAVSEFDPGFMDMYAQFASKLLKSKDPGVAMMWSVPVEEGISPDEVKESLQSLATERNFLFVGESPFYKQVEAITGEPYRYINFLSFCDASVGKMMADYRDVYTGFMPCRIAIVEDKNGKLWLHSMNLDMMIYGGKTLPPELKKEAQRVRDVIQEMMAGAAAGEF